MSLFRRKGSVESVPDGDVDLAAVNNQDEVGGLPEDAAGTGETGEAGETGDPVPLSGPWDVAEAPEDDSPRLDLGGLRVPGFPGMELRLEVDRTSERVIAATAVALGGQLQLQGFAAPRREGLWAEVRAEIVEGASAAGGTITESAGRFGIELVGQVPADDPSGPLQPARFVGVDGPRWFLRGVFSGAAATPGESADLLDQVFAGTLVVRGDTAMAPRDLLALKMPDQAAPVAPIEAEEEGRPPLAPFRRGPEITEIR